VLHQAVVYLTCQAIGIQHDTTRTNDDIH